MMNENEVARCRTLSKLGMYNFILDNPSFTFPMIDDSKLRMPILGGENGNEYTPAKELNRDWIYVSTCQIDELNTYWDELDDLELFLDYQLDGAKYDTAYSLRTLRMEQQDTPGYKAESDNVNHVPSEGAQVIVPLEVGLSVDKYLTEDGQLKVSGINRSEEPIGPEGHPADVEYELGLLYTIKELAEPTSSSEPIEVNHTTEAHCVENSIMTDISNKVLDVHKATPKVGVKDETHLAVHPTSQAQQPAVRLVQCIGDLASSVYDVGGRPIQSTE